MSKITRNYVYNLIYQIFVMFIPIVTAPYLARVLGAENQGIFSYVQSVANIVSTVTLLGISSYGNRQIAYDRNDKIKMSNTFWEIMVTRVILASIGTIIYLILAILLSKYTVYFCYYYIWLIGTYVDCTWLYVGVEDMKPAVIKNFVAKILAVIGIFMFVKSSKDLINYIVIWGLSVLVANLLAFSQLKKYVLKPLIKWKNIIFHIKGSAQLFLPYVATLIYLQVDKVMIELLTKQTNQVSFYDNAEKIVTIPLTFITVLSTVMMPRIANEFKNGNRNNIKKYLIKAGDVSLYLAFPMTFGLILLSKQFVPWYLGNEFIPVYLGIIIISPIIISNSLVGISGKQYFMATNQIMILLVSYMSTAIMNIIINLLLIPKFGFIGAAIATLISSYTNVIIQFTYLNKQIYIKEILSNSMRYITYSVFMSIIIFVITNNMKSTPITTIIQIMIGVVTYFGISYLMKEKVFLELIYKIILSKIKK